VAIAHPDDGFPCLFDPGQYLLVLDLQFGVVLCLLSYALADVVILARVGSHVGQDGHLVDVGIVFRVDVFEFRKQGGIAGAGQAGISFVDLGVGIADMEVGVVVICWQPAGSGVGDLVGLGSEALTLD